jgi:hypothetical protein
MVPFSYGVYGVRGVCGVCGGTQDGEEERSEGSEEHTTGIGAVAEVDWRARYRATFDVPKGERKKDTIVVRLDTTVFTATGALDPPISGEVRTTTAHAHAPPHTHARTRIAHT